jgi:hypothetical protein
MRPTQSRVAEALATCTRLVLRLVVRLVVRVVAVNDAVIALPAEVRKQGHGWVAIWEVGRCAPARLEGALEGLWRRREGVDPFPS